ncbi:hypothetical protein D3C72_2150470 [compost metagenome]
MGRVGREQMDQVGGDPADPLGVLGEDPGIAHGQELAPRAMRRSSWPGRMKDDLGSPLRVHVGSRRHEKMDLGTLRQLVREAKDRVGRRA